MSSDSRSRIKKWLTQIVNEPLSHWITVWSQVSVMVKVGGLHSRRAQNGLSSPLIARAPDSCCLRTKGKRSAPALKVQLEAWNQFMTRLVITSDGVALDALLVYSTLGLTNETWTYEGRCSTPGRFSLFLNSFFYWKQRPSQAVHVDADSVLNVC